MFYVSLSVISHLRAALFFNVLKTLKRLWNAETVCVGVLFQFYFTCASVWNNMFCFSFISCCPRRLNRRCEAVTALTMESIACNIVKYNQSTIRAVWNNQILWRIVTVYSRPSYAYVVVSQTLQLYCKVRLLSRYVVRRRRRCRLWREYIVTKCGFQWKITDCLKIFRVTFDSGVYATYSALRAQQV